MFDGPTQLPKPSGPPSPIDVTADPSSGPPPSRGTSSFTFAAGAILADRYRLVSILGKGGMGEVWRADDLVLGTSVALKFLPGSLALDAMRLDRFRAEVRLARQVAHQHVCRVYDIAELAAAPNDLANVPRVFISMEFVDGEDLCSLLRRIGRLPNEKAAEVARQVCLGLAAAHEQDVIHRDLKPANIMLDGRGRVRIMDFGLASAGAVRGGADALAGTPLYMAPEQLAGIEASKRTDIYALGLVLYELFTGKPAHVLGDKATMADLRRLHESHATPITPSSHIADIDPLVEHVILRCLEREPVRRPASAIAVAAALPGGDPLAAALAAGETPSPEMIAQSGQVGSLSPAVAWTYLLAALGLTALLGLICGWTSILRFTPLPLSTEVLRNKATEVARSLGYPANPGDDNAEGFMASRGYLDLIAESDPSPDRWKRLAEGSPPTIIYWYRESPESLYPTSVRQRSATLDEPAPFYAGSLSVQLDPRGRLLGFDAAPPARFDPAVATKPPDWTPCFTAAGLKVEDFEPVTPVRAPWHASDTRAAWRGKHPKDPVVPIQIEAAAEHGVVTSFRVLAPWSNNERAIIRPDDAGSRLYTFLDTGMLVTVLVGGGILTYRTLRAGKGDKRGAPEPRALCSAGQLGRRRALR